MPTNIVVEDNRLQSLSEDAKIKLKDEVDVYINQVISEANLIEETLREKGAKKEITSTHIMQAVRKGQRNIKKATPWYIKICKVVSPISLTALGALYDSSNALNNARGIWFTIVLLISVITTILQYIKEEK